MWRETVVYLQTQQCVGVLAVAPQELLYCGTHVVIGHHPRCPAKLPEAVAVGLHECQSILTREQICLAHIAVVKGEYSHVQARPYSAEPQCQHAPVKLAPEPRLIVLTDICPYRLLLLLRHCLQCAHILTHCGICNMHAIVLKASPHIKFAHLLLVKTGGNVLPVAGDKTVNAAAYLIGHHPTDAAAAVILRFCQYVIVNLPLCR